MSFGSLWKLTGQIIVTASRSEWICLWAQNPTIPQVNNTVHYAISHCQIHNATWCPGEMCPTFCSVIPLCCRGETDALRELNSNASSSVRLHIVSLMRRSACWRLAIQESAIYFNLFIFLPLLNHDAHFPQLMSVLSQLSKLPHKYIQMQKHSLTYTAIQLCIYCTYIVGIVLIILNQHQ